MMSLYCWWVAVWERFGFLIELIVVWYLVIDGKVDLSRIMSLALWWFFGIWCVE